MAAAPVRVRAGRLFERDEKFFGAEEHEVLWLAVGGSLGRWCAL